MAAIVSLSLSPVIEGRERRKIVGQLDLLQNELNQDPHDFSDLSQKLKIWIQGCKNSLKQHPDHPEEVLDLYLPLLLEMQIPADSSKQHRMLKPLGEFFTRNMIPIPRSFIPADTLRRLDRIRALQLGNVKAQSTSEALQRRLTPFASAAQNLVEEYRDLSHLIEQAAEKLEDARVATEEKVQELHKRVDEVQNGVKILEQNLKCADRALKIAQATQELLKREILETKEAIERNNQDSLGGMLIAVGCVIAAYVATSGLAAGGINGSVQALQGGAQMTLIFPF